MLIAFAISIILFVIMGLGMGNIYGRKSREEDIIKDIKGMGYVIIECNNDKFIITGKVISHKKLINKYLEAEKLLKK